MTDDRVIEVFMPHLMPKISGAVMRALITLSGLSGLPVGISQIERQVDLSTDGTTMRISTLS